MSHKKILISLVMWGSLAATASAGQVTMTTYYPSPFGAYQQLRLVPTTPLACDASTEGLMFYDSALDVVKVCKGAAGWSPLGGGVWTQAGNYIYPVDTATNPNLNVGIGTIDPGNYSIHVEKTGDASLKLVADSDNNNNGDNPLIFMTQDGGGNAFLIGMTGTAGTDPLESLYADTTQNAMFVGDPGGGGPTGNLQFGTNDAVRMTIDGSTGNVGIGTATPTDTLTVNGTFGVTSNAFIDGNLNINAVPHVDSGVSLYAWSNAAAYGIFQGMGDADNYAAISLMTDASVNNQVWQMRHGRAAGVLNKFNIAHRDATGTWSYPMTIDTADNVGIGTTTPTAKLEVSGGAIKATGGLIIETRTDNPATPATGQMWLCVDTGDATPCNGI